MKTKMKFLAILSLLTIFLSFAFQPLNDKKIIVIDAGHGGKDFGVEIDDVLEKKIVQNIAKKVSLLNTKGEGEIEVILLQENDDFIELSERVAKINKINPSLVISLHVNVSKNAKEHGINAYVSKDNGFHEKSIESAKTLVDKISNKKLAKGEVKNGNLFILKNSNCPAVVLEIGYLSNKSDKTYITSENGQNEIANSIFEFIKE